MVVSLVVDLAGAVVAQEGLLNHTLRRLSYSFTPCTIAILSSYEPSLPQAGATEVSLSRGCLAPETNASSEELPVVRRYHWWEGEKTSDCMTVSPL